jgi:SecY interacting protein Syd
MDDVRAILESLLARHDGYRVEHDTEWVSPCEVGEPDSDGMVVWRAVPMEREPDLTIVELQLGAPLDSGVKAFFESFWAGLVSSRHSGEPVMLMTSWNEEALDKLLRNLAIHVAMQQKDGVRVTIPIANTDSDLYFAVALDTGEVVLEEAGRGNGRVVAPNLRQFLAEL